MPWCNECGCRVEMKRRRRANGLDYCPACLKQRRKRLADRKKPGAIQIGSSMANRIIAVPASQVRDALGRGSDQR